MDPLGGAILIDTGKRLDEFDLATGTWRTVLSPATYGAQYALSPDGRLVAVPVGDKIEVRSIRTGWRLFGLDALPSPSVLAGLAFSPDGHQLRALYYDGTLRTYRDDHEPAQRSLAAARG